MQHTPWSRGRFLILNTLSHWKGNTSLKRKPSPTRMRNTKALRSIMIKSPVRLLCLFALWRPDLQEHWNSLQSDEAFGSVRTTLCSTLGIIIILASTLIGLSSGFKVTGSVNYVDYTSEPASYLMLIATLMFAIVAMMISGLSTISWLYTDRHWAQEQLKQGGSRVVFYLLSIVAPKFFVVLSLTCLTCATLIAGFCSQSIVGRVVATLLGAVLVYVRTAAVLLLLTSSANGRDRWRRYVLGVLVCAALAEGYVLVSVPATLLPKDAMRVFMWHDNIRLTRQVLFLLFPLLTQFLPPSEQPGPPACPSP
ncbi:hypothetical protein EDB19DRAFT_2041707 [Suillus lakei]|nr:hypothetical protein EDB19DRAFT_2041707 [Suillus lakei]